MVLSAVRGRTNLELLQKLGMAAAVMGQSAQYCQYPVACLPLWIEPAIRHEQIHFFLDHAGSAVGYMTWAWLAADTEYRLAHDPSVLLHLSEWNEGDRLWVLDFVLLGGELRSRVREAADLFGRDQQVVRFLRRREDETVKAVHTWQRGSSNSTFHPKKSTGLSMVCHT